MCGRFNQTASPEVIAQQLVEADDQWIRKHMGIVSYRLVMELRGVSCLEALPDLFRSIIRVPLAKKGLWADPAPISPWAYRKARHRVPMM